MTEAAGAGFRFVTGGTLPPDSPSYVRRAADDQLLAACIDGRFAYVLSSRQMGKSSLLARTIEALRLQSITVATVDLTAIGTQGLTPETWYAGVLAEIERSCSPQTDLFDWWAQAALQSPVQRFVRYLDEVVLAEVPGRVVVVIDEIDSTLKLDFSDDFYAAIRHLHNARADKPALARLSFVLAGMATPTELIHDAARTPFNIGQRIEMNDFGSAEVGQLVAQIGLAECDVAPITAEVLHWAGGQPYLTQRLCALLAAEPDGHYDGSAIQRVANAVASGLLSEAGRSDAHFQSVSRFMIAASAELKADLFDTYARVLAGRSVVCLDASAAHNRLRLCGIVKRRDDKLVTRNGVYGEVFGPAWLRRHRPTFWTPANRAWAAAMALSLLVTSGFAWLWLRAEHATALARDARAEAVTGREQAERATEQARLAADDAQAANLAATSQASQKAGDPDAALMQASRGLATRVTPVSMWAAFEAAEQSQAEAALAGHRDTVYQVAFSPDGQHAASASHDASLRLWNLPAGASPAVLAGHTGPVVSVAFSADGKRLLSASHDHTARLWSADGGHPLLTLQGHTDRLMAAAFSPDASVVATASQDGSARLWRSDRGQLLHTLLGHRSWVRLVAFSPDGRRLATAGNDGDLRLWSVPTGRLIARLVGHRDWVRSLAFSADGRQLLSASDDATARIWAVDTGRQIQLLRGRNRQRDAADAAPDALPGSLRHAVFDATGQRVASAGGDGAVRLWRIRDGRQIAVWREHRGWVNGVRFVDDSQLLSVGDDGTAVLHQVGRNTPVLTLRGHRQAVLDVALDAKTRRALTASEDHGVRLWSLRPGSRLDRLTPSGKAVNDVAWSADGRYLLLGGEAGVARLHPVDGNGADLMLSGSAAAPAGAAALVTSGAAIDARLASPEPVGAEITTVALSADGRYAATGSKRDTSRPAAPNARPASANADTPLRLYDARTGQALKLPGPGHRATVNSVCFSPDGQWLASAGDDDQALLWSTQGDRPAMALTGHQGAVNSAVFSADGRRVLTASADGTARLWSVPDGRLLHALAHGNDSQRLRMASFSADGLQAATAGDDHRVRIWDAVGGQLRLTLEGHTDTVMSAHFSPDGRHLVSASQDRQARVWDLRTGRTVHVLEAGRTDIARLARYSPDGQLIATTSDDGHTRLWRSADGARVGDYLHADWVWQATFSPDGRRLATASEDGSAAVWDLTRSAGNPAGLAAWMNQRLRRLQLPSPEAAPGPAPAASRPSGS